MKAHRVSRSVSSGFAALALGFAIVQALRADVIELSDGRKFNGTLSRNGDIVTIRTDDGKTITAKPGDISKVTLNSSTSPEEMAAAEWTRIGPLVKSADDLQSVIALYQGFLSKFPDAKQSAEAKAALSSYQLIAKSEPVKFRGHWIPKAQIDVVMKQWSEAAAPALALYKSGRLKEALEATKAPLTQDPQNPDALTIAGLAAYRTGAIPAARIQFAALAASDPTSVLAENNLGVISFQQKLNGESLGHYAKALQISIDNRQVLDNAAEAMNAYLTTGGDKTGMSYRALQKMFDPAEAHMEQVMAKQGMQRWGSSWVTKERAADLSKYADALKGYLTQIEGQYKQARDAIASMEGQVRQLDVDYENYLQTFNTANNQIIVNQGRVFDAGYLASQRDIALQNMDRIARQKSQLVAQHDQYLAASHDFFVQVDKLRIALGSNGGLPGYYNGMQRILDLGETENPPAPAAVPDPTPLPTIQAPPAITTNTPALVPPAPVLIPVIVPIPVASGGEHEHNGRGRGGRGGPDTRPSTQPSTQPATQPSTQPDTQPSTQPNSPAPARPIGEGMRRN